MQGPMLKVTRSQEPGLEMFGWTWCFHSPRWLFVHGRLCLHCIHLRVWIYRSVRALDVLHTRSRCFKFMNTDRTQINPEYSWSNVCCALMCMSVRGYFSHCRSRVALLVCLVCCLFSYALSFLHLLLSGWKVFSVFVVFLWIWLYLLCPSHFTLSVPPHVPLHTNL